MKKNIKNLESIIEYKFKDLNLLELSLKHKSYDNENNNEKLEFLGDRVLGLIISQKLLNIYPAEKEGIIDKKYANLVNKQTCSAIAKSINLSKFMYLGTSQMPLQRSEKIMSDCLEALIGAIYLNSGLKSAEQFVFKFWDQFLKNSAMTLIDPKTKLQEYSLKKYKILPKYSFYKKTGPHHRPIFKTNVQIPNSRKIIGTGSSKKTCSTKCGRKIVAAT